MPLTPPRPRPDAPPSSFPETGGRFPHGIRYGTTGRGSGGVAVAVAPEAPAFRFFEEGITPLLFPVLYAMFIAAATLDITLTWVILSMGGVEVNPIARLVIEAWGLNGAIAFKYALTVFVIVLCEAVGRHRPGAGRMLAITAVAISSFPVIWSSSLLLSLALWL
jgi:hypothetical protein